MKKNANALILNVKELIIISVLAYDVNKKEVNH